MVYGKYLRAEKKKDLYVKWMQVCAFIEAGNHVLISIVYVFLVTFSQFSFK